MITRFAENRDCNGISNMVESLISELTGEKEYKFSDSGRNSVAMILENSDIGFYVVAENASELIGFGGVSFQYAARTYGCYAILQELYVKSEARSLDIGAKLMHQIVKAIRIHNVTILEVGLPRHRYSGLSRVSAFYHKQGFTLVGDRMRLTIDH